MLNIISSRCEVCQISLRKKERKLCEIEKITFIRFIELKTVAKLTHERAQRTGLNFRIFPTFRRPNCSICEKTRPQAPIIKIFKNEKNYPSYPPKIKCAKFKPNPTIFEVSRLPQSFSLVFAKNSSPGPKNQIFQKMKKHPQIFIQGTSVQNFSKIGPFFKSLGGPKVFGHTHRETQTFSDSCSTEVENIKELLANF